MITLRSVTAILLVALATLLPTSRRITSVARTLDAAGLAAVPDSTFRLGNAGGRFGVSTAIGDFNADGLADAIVADRIAPHASGYSYRIAFTMSGQAPELVTFESTRDAVAITVSDVDRDNDLDVVARAVLSGETVGLWLNDGHGHFTSADAHTIPAVFEATQTIDVTETPLPALMATPPPTRVDAWLPAAFRAPPSPARSQALASTSPRQPISILSIARGPRAPPQASLAFVA